MADFNRLNLSVTSRQDVIDAIRAFLTVGMVGSTWTEDVSWAGVPGRLFLENTNGSTVGYFYFHEDVGSNLLLAGLVGCNAVGAGYGAAGGPLATALNITEGDDYGVGVFLDSTGALMGGEGTLHLFGNEDRLIACLRCNRQSVYSLLFIGFYTPHCTALDDTCPMAAVSNSPGTYYLISETSGGVNSPAEPPVEEWQHSFPLGMLKYDALGARRYIRHELSRFNPEDGFLVIPSRRSRIPRNERAAAFEIFAYDTYVGIAEKSKGESVTLDGVYRCSDGIDLETTVTIGANDYFSWPSAVQPDVNPRCYLLGPIGTAV